jgi:hypothetical protein
MRTAVVVGAMVASWIVCVVPAAHADTPCSTGGKPGFDASPGFYQDRYSAVLAKTLKQDLSVYDSAVAAKDMKGAGVAGGTLYSEIFTDLRMIDDPALFGCYNPKVQTGLQTVANAWSPILETMSCAGPSSCGHDVSEMPALVAKSAPLENGYIKLINAYASQFGGQQIITSWPVVTGQ